MRIDSIHVRNFRCFEDVAFTFDDRFTLLIGSNATGKTTILDALAVALGAVLVAVPDATGVSIRNRDVRRTCRSEGDTTYLVDHYPTCVAATGRLDGKQLRWTRELKSGKSRTTQAGSKAIHETMGILMQRSANEQASFPLIGYYGTGRLWAEQRPTGKSMVDSATRESRFAGYMDCLAPSSSAQRMVARLKRLALIQVQMGKPLKTLEAICQAIANTVDSAVEANFDFKEDDIAVRFEGRDSFPLRLLSDGQRSMAAMAADIAMRCSLLNPHLSEQSVLDTEGVVLIDELDLHLHPRWQRGVVRDLTSTFPNLQFVATSHSPFIVQSMNIGSVINLDEEQYELESIDEQSIEDVAETIMGVEQPQRSKRFRQMIAAAEEYYDFLECASETTDSETAKVLREKLEVLEEPFADNPAYVAFLRLQRTAKNLD